MPPFEKTHATFAALVKSGVLDVTDGYRAKNSELGGNGPLFLRAGHVTDSHINFEGAERFHAKLAAKVANKLSRAGDVVITTKGNSTGRTAFVTPEMPEFVYSPHLSRWRVLDRDKLDPGFLRYWSISREFQVQLRGMMASTDMAPYLSLRDQLRIEIGLPEVQEQRAIAGVLGALDDKIEQNRQTSRALERLARAIFQAWFVDFEPVKAKAAGKHEFRGVPREAFDALPDGFVESEHGAIPVGWSVGTPGDLGSLVLGGDWGKDSPLNEDLVPALCIRGADIPSLQMGGTGNMPVRFLKATSLAKRSLRPGDLVVEISGGSPTQSTGRTVFISKLLLDRLQHPLVCSNFCRMLRPKGYLSAYVYFWLRWLYSSDQLLQYETGTIGIKNFGFTVFSERHFVFIPPKPVLGAFERQVTPLMDLMAHAGAESAKLAELRDLLLPKLLSGELRTTNRDKPTGESP